MGEKKKTLFEINVENFEFSPSPRFGDELAEAVEEIDGKGSKLGLFGSSETDEGSDDEDGGGLFSGSSDEEVELEPEDDEATDVDVEEPEEESGSPIALVIGLLFLLVVAAAAKKFVVEGETEEYEEVELSEYEN